MHTLFPVAPSSSSVSMEIRKFSSQPKGSAMALQCQAWIVSHSNHPD